MALLGIDIYGYSIIAAFLVIAAGYYYLVFKPGKRKGQYEYQSAKARGSSKVIRESGEYFVEAWTPYQDGSFDIRYDTNDTVLYSREDLVPLNPGQALADNTPQIWFERAVVERLAVHNSAKIIADLRRDLTKTNEEADDWQRQYHNLKNNYQKDLDKDKERMNSMNNQNSGFGSQRYVKKTGSN